MSNVAILPLDVLGPCGGASTFGAASREEPTCPAGGSRGQNLAALAEFSQ